MRPRSVDISVEGYVGLPGAGKTYALAHRGLDFMRLGHRVFSNFGLEGSEPIRGWDCDNVGNTKDPGPACECGHCFVSISRAVVLVDEINLWAPSRMWNALPMALLHRWAQVRKYQTRILWSAQHEARVDKVIREVTGYIWECRAIPGARLMSWVPGWPTFSLRALDPADFRKQGAKPIRAERLKLRKRVALAYDTFETVDMGSHLVPVRAAAAARVLDDRTAPVGLGASSLADPWGLPTASEREEALASVRYGASRGTSPWSGSDFDGLVDLDANDGERGDGSQ